MAEDASLRNAFARTINANRLDIPTPLVFNDSINTTNMANVLLIDSTLADKQVFYDSVNANTFPIIYDYNSKTDHLLALFRQKFPTSSIQRISLVFHDKGTDFMAAFMNNKPLFQESDLAENQTSFSDNVSFLISCMKEFHVSHIDFLACNTLQYSNWKSYYALLVAQTSVVVGASNDKTGNLNYGGDWIMENTHENVRDLYFNPNISNYASTLVLSSITLNGANGDVGLRMNAGVIEYYNTTTIAWTPIGSGNWPVQFINSNLSSILRVVFTQDLTINSGYGNTLGYFIAGSAYITFDGLNNYININSITSYPGFIQNGSSLTLTNGKNNVIVQNIKTNVIGVSTLSTAVNASAGWICASSFGRGASANQIINCTNNGAIDDYCGGICGERAAVAGGNVTMTNCQNTGNITGISGGGGGIVGYSAGESGTFYISGCTNSGSISAQNAGGIAGQQAGYISGSATFVNCTNTGIINGIYAGGIAGQFAGYIGTAVFTNCMNTGVINEVSAGGIAGDSAGSTNGSVTITGCTNYGAITTPATYAGGIVGSIAGSISGLVTITNCFSTGLISGLNAGGVAGQGFAYDTSRNCVISQCYSTGAISGDSAGGIVGADVGYTDNVLITPNVNITNSYSLGAIATTAGGICGGTDGATYAVNPNITITNCYSSGTIVDTNSGMVAIGLLIPITKTHTYVANNNWSDASANAPTALTGTPTGVGLDNKGVTWTSYASANTPYLLSSYWSLTGALQLYTPNNVSTFTNYTSSGGLYTSGTYSIASSSQNDKLITLNIIRIASTSPYYGYYGGTFALRNLNGGSGTPISATINASNGVLDFILPYPCFLEGTKILCFENNEEVYRPIERLRKGDLVKTIYNGYMPIYMIGTSVIYNLGNDYRVANRLYKCPKEKYPTLIEDLYITGCHSILVPSMTDDEWENTKAIHKEVYITDNHFRLIACADEKAEPYNKEGFMNIYHIALENNDYYMNYGIYANGLLVESCSKRYLTELANMRILGEEDCAISEDMYIDGGDISNNMKCQLVDTY